MFFRPREERKFLNIPHVADVEITHGGWYVHVQSATRPGRVRAVFVPWFREDEPEFTRLILEAAQS